MSIKEFYPTPKHVISKMLSYLKLKHNSQILDPSAGKGDILDYIKETQRYNYTKNLFCIEINPDLQFILQGKNYRLVDSDFLKYGNDGYFDTVIMNPPFSDGHKHLLKAWELVADGGQIACLLNAETINNPFSNSRKQLLKIIENNKGQIIELGNAFSLAERKTDVNVILIILNKPEVKGKDLFDNDLNFEKEFNTNEADFTDYTPAKRNMIVSLVEQYQAARNELITINKHEKRLNYYTTSIYAIDDDVQSLNERLTNLKENFWNYVFEKTDFGNGMTSAFVLRLRKFKTQSQNMSFTVMNILNIFSLFIENKETLMLETLNEVFDETIKYDDKNKVHWEGWKSNSAYKVNKKVIVPFLINTEYAGFGINYSRGRDYLDDLDRVLCHLTGNKISNIKTCYDALTEQFEVLKKDRDYGDCSYGKGENVCYSEFFKLQFYKKGTLHLYWLDSDLLQKFNITYADGKNWLPEQTDKK